MREVTLKLLDQVDEVNDLNTGDVVVFYGEEQVPSLRPYVEIDNEGYFVNKKSDDVIFTIPLSHHNVSRLEVRSDGALEIAANGEGVGIEMECWTLNNKNQQKYSIAQQTTQEAGLWQ